jgi:phenylacetate-CoA ligase
LKRLDRTQWCSLDELCALQAGELRKLIAHAWRNVPHYRTRFEQAGLAPHDLKTLDDLRKLPLLTREQAVTEQAARQSLVPPLPSIAKSTSGTTGSPLTFAYDRGSEYWRQAIKLRGYGWAGYGLGDRSLHFWGSPPSEPPPLAAKLKVSVDRAIRREHFADCTDRSDAALREVVREIRALRPSVIVCYAQAGVALARHVNENKSRDWDDIPVITAAEGLFPTDRATIAEAFGKGIFETYGSREVMLMAAECEAHQGLHVSMENILLELVVRDANGTRPARAGELGEVVVTDLHNFGAPFIRYLNGDSAVARAPERCACGRALSRLERVEGRTTDTLRDGAGRPVSGLFFGVLFAGLADRVREFQVVQRRDRAIDVNMVPTSSADDSLLELVRRHCRRFIPGVVLRAQLVPELNLDPSGKRRVVKVES